MQKSSKQKNDELITIEGYSLSPENINKQGNSSKKSSQEKNSSSQKKREKKEKENSGDFFLNQSPKMKTRNTINHPMRSQLLNNSRARSKTYAPKPRTTSQSYQSLKKHLTRYQASKNITKPNKRSQSENFQFLGKSKKLRNVEFLVENHSEKLSQTIDERDLNLYKEEVNKLKRQLEEFQQSSKLGETAHLEFTEQFPITEYLKDQRVDVLSRRNLEGKLTKLRSDFSTFQHILKNKDEDFLALKIKNSKLQSQVYFLTHKNASDNEEMIKILSEKILNFEGEILLKVRKRTNEVRNLEELVKQLGAKYKGRLRFAQEKIQELTSELEHLNGRVDNIMKENINLKQKIGKESIEEKSQKNEFFDGNDFRRKSEKQMELIQIKGNF